MSDVDKKSLRNKLVDTVGEQSVLSEEAYLLDYTKANIGAGKKPILIARPKTAAEVEQLIGLAKEDSHSPPGAMFLLGCRVKFHICFGFLCKRDFTGGNLPQGDHNIFIFGGADQILRSLPYLPDPFCRQVYDGKPVGNPFQTVFNRYTRQKCTSINCY